MEQYLEEYGDLPQDLGEVILDSGNAEMCFVQYLPVLIPLQKSLCVLPNNLLWCKPIIDHVYYDMILNNHKFNYVYLTVKKIYGSGNREGWHSDGFGTDDINYVWYDTHPTDFYSGKNIKLSHDHFKSMEEMEDILSGTTEIVRYPERHLIKMDQSTIHRVNPSVCDSFRTFIKVSVSDEIYNLKGNARNYALDYDWEYVDRDEKRNHPIKK